MTLRHSRAARAPLLVAAAAVLSAPPAWSQQGAAEDHSAHREMERRPGYSRTLERYALPAVTLVDQNGAEVPFASIGASNKPVALNFIFATCATICPVMTATFAKMREELGAEASDLQMVSITIDPEHDTPEVLSQYAESHGAGAGWLFLTGELEQVVAAQRAFEAYSGNKMSHRPLSFFKLPGKDEWLRIDGLAGGATLAEEYRRLSGR